MPRNLDSRRLVFFDTETTGLPLDYNAPATCVDNWPRLVQLSWIVANGQQIVRTEDHIVRPVGFVIPADAASVHGITQERALAEGEDLQSVLQLFARDLEDSQCVVGHNVDFDVNVAGAEFYRNDYENPFEHISRLDTMKSSVEYCKLPGKRGTYKWPRLSELHRILFGCDFSNAHNSMADIKATFDCYWRLKQLGVMK